MATPAWIYGDLAGLLVEADLQSIGRLRPATLELLCLLRVGRIVASGRTAMGMPDSVDVAEPDGPLGRTVMTRCAYDVVFARALAAADFSPVEADVRYGADHLTARMPQFTRFVDRLLSGMKIDSDTGVAQRILVPGLVEPMSVAASEATTRPSVETRSYEVTSSRVRVALDSATAGFVRLSHAWHPGLTILRNGMPAEVHRDITNCIVVSIAAGPNVIEIAPMPVPAVSVGNAISLAVLVGLILLILASAWPATHRSMTVGQPRA
jgi:hypothetical protein